MVRLRKLVQAIAAASALTTGMAHALGLGDIHLHSALNQPLNADIDVTDVRDLSAGEIIPKLASPEDFSKSGVDRNFFLTGLKFTAVVQPNGKSVIHVTSDKPVQEPYLNFLVEVLWPSGRVLREYTVLLDPPLYSPQVAAAAAPRAPVAAPAPIARQPVAAAPAAPRAVEPAPAASAPRQARLDGNEYRTGSRDTLWEIASRARPDGSVTVNQTMLAIQDLNPDAFIDGNINRLKSGQVLRLPDAEQIRSRSAGDADVQVREQRSAWREGRSLAGSSRQLDATRRANAGAAPEQAESKDNLRLVSGEAGKNKGSDKGAKNGKALSDKLAVTQESLDSTRRENDELQGRMTDLQSQLDKLQKLIQLKDAQLAKLQGELATPPQPAAPGSAPAGQPPAPAAEAPAAPAPQPEAAAPAQPAPPAAAKPAEPKPAAPKPAAPAPAAENQPGLIEELLANPTLLAAIGGSLVLVLLLVLLLLRRRAAQAEAAKVEPAVSGPSGTDEPLELAAGEFDSLSLADEDVTPASTPAAGEKVAAQTGDPLGEADIYIAYGRFNQAAELLQGAIYDEPQRADLRLKLMEVLAEIGDREGFARQENELRELGGAEPQVEQLKSRYPGMVAAAAVAGGLAAAAASSDELEHFSLDDLDLTQDHATPAEPVAAAAGDLDDAFDLGLDDLQLDDDQPHPATEPQAKADELTLEDFDLEADLGLDAPAAAAQPARPDDDFAFDLDLDLDDDLAKAAPVAPTASDALDDFTLDLPDEPAAPAAKDEDFLFDLGEEGAGLAASADDDFSFDLGPEPEAKPVEGLADDFDLSLPEEAPQELPADDSFAAQLDQVSAELDKLASDLERPASPAAPLEDGIEAEPSLEAASLDASSLDEDALDDEFDFLSGADEAATKLDLARAYIDMGDAEGARDILDEVISEGSDQQQKEARELLERLS
ncbi:FimV/HubP family polar landmark protein [Pseudomonas delhiensis]|uniref:FimV/HubP family polar landmark protein n=1 Tax=Pseudomonas delhiensis TaxID=366289 RepID=UPI00315A5B39